MNAVDVIEIYTELERRGVRIWIDGGWGVDALLGRQTRPHADLDIAVEENSVQALRTLLKRLASRKPFGTIQPHGTLFWLTLTSARSMCMRSSLMHMATESLAQPSWASFIRPAR